MIIQPFPSGPFETNAYVVACSKTREAAIIDPAPESAEKVIDFITKEDLTPIAMLITHSHWDHIGDAFKLKEHYSIPVYIHSLDVPNLKQPGSDGLPMWIDIRGVVPDKTFSEGDLIKIGTIEFKVIHTPGHTPGGVCFYSEKQSVLLSGDTLFKGSIGNLSFPTSVPNAMWGSLEKLAKLPAQTIVYPGHGPSTTIGKESWLSKAQELFGFSS